MTTFAQKPDLYLIVERVHDKRGNPTDWRVIAAESDDGKNITQVAHISEDPDLGFLVEYVAQKTGAALIQLPDGTFTDGESLTLSEVAEATFGLV